MRANFNPFAVSSEALLEGMKVTNIANDHGGLTGAYGITNNEFQGYLLATHQPSRGIATLSAPDAIAILDLNYWTPSKCDLLPIGLDFTMFQWACNRGDGGAAYTLQKTLGVVQDGDLGPQTMAAVKAIFDDPMPAIAAFLENQRAWYTARVAKDPTQQEFLQGWINRTYRTWDIVNGRPLSC